LDCLLFNHLVIGLTSAEFFSASSDIYVIAQDTLGGQAEPIGSAWIDQ
jgi:hypothetical protein